MGHIFEFFSKVFEPCTAARVNTEEEGLFALAVKTASEKKQLYVINHSGSKIEAELPEGNWVSIKGMQGKSRMAHETETQSSITDCHLKIIDRKCIIPRLSIFFLECSNGF